MRWKVVFGLVSSFYVVRWTRLLVSWEVDLFEAIDFPLTAVGLVGLFGYAYQRRIGTRKLWQSFFLLFLGWKFLYPSVERFFRRRGSSAAEINDNSFELWSSDGMVLLALLVLAAAILLAHFVALFRYGYRSDDLWRT